MKTALYQGDGRLISGVVRCGRAFHPRKRMTKLMLRGEGWHKSCHPADTRGEYTPDTPEVGDRGRVSGGVEARVGGREGGRYP